LKNCTADCQVCVLYWNVKFDEKIVEYLDDTMGYEEDLVLEELEEAIKLYEENKELDDKEEDLALEELEEEAVLM